MTIKTTGKPQEQNDPVTVYTLRSLNISETMTYGQIRWRLTWGKLWARCGGEKRNAFIFIIFTDGVTASSTDSEFSKVNRSIFTAQIQPNASKLSRWPLFPHSGTMTWNLLLKQPWSVSQSITQPESHWACFSLIKDTMEGKSTQDRL